MYTFYSKLTHTATPAGMTNKAHERLVKSWKKSWKEAGWDAIVLTMDDAKQHPDFYHFERLLNRTGAGPYDRLCFFRWLAMSNVGGGWMSDYDVFNLHDFRHEGFHLPNKGNLTVHNRMCPSLVSGSEDEWARVTRELIEYAAEEKINTDQKTIARLFKDNPTLLAQDLSVTQQILNVSDWDSADCKEHTPSSLRAIHFAHTPVKKAMKQGLLSNPKWTVENRSEIANQWVDQWLDRCEVQKFKRDPKLIDQSRSASFKKENGILPNGERDNTKRQTSSDDDESTTRNQKQIPTGRGKERKLRKSKKRN